MREKDNDNKLTDTKEAEELYEIYKRVQSGDKSALDELFKRKDVKRISRPDEDNRKERMQNMDGVLDAESVMENEKNKLEDEWIKSAYSGVEFAFPCLNKMLFKKKSKFLQKWKDTGCKNGEKENNDTTVKFYDGEYDVSDFNELMYEVVLEIFNAKTDEDGCIALDGKRNDKCPICDGASLLKNVSYFTARQINRRAKTSHLDIYDTENYNENLEIENSLFDAHSFKDFLENGNGLEPVNDTSRRMPMYEEYLQWLQRNDVCKLFKFTSCDIKALINVIMNCEESFKLDEAGDKKMGFGMRFVSQKTLQELIKDRHNLNIGQENISKDLQFIEQRLLDFLFYSLNYRIGKAKKSEGIFEKESERFLDALYERSYIHMFGVESYIIYDMSVIFLVGDDYGSYLSMVKRHEDAVMNVISLEKGKKKYDMVNLLYPETDDLVDDKQKALRDIAGTMISCYQKKEIEYINNELNQYKLKGFADWKDKRWEAGVKSDVLKIRLWSSKNIKKPIRHNIDKDRLIVYCGYVSFYFCDTEEKICYRLPKDKRIISRSNKNQEVSIYNVK